MLLSIIVGIAVLRGKFNQARAGLEGNSVGSGWREAALVERLYEISAT